MSVGDRALVELQGVKRRFQTHIVGWVEGECCLLKLPQQLGAADYLCPEKRLLMRLLNDRGELLGFQSSVKGIIHCPRLLVIDYPSHVEAISLRKAERATCFIPATLSTSEVAAEGYVLNISRGGLQFASEPGMTGLKEHVRTEESVELAFQFIGWSGVRTVCGLVRTVKSEDDKVFVGVEFLEPNPAVVSSIDEYVAKVVEYMESC